MAVLACTGLGALRGGFAAAKAAGGLKAFTGLGAKGILAGTGRNALTAAKGLGRGINNFISRTISGSVSDTARPVMRAGAGSGPWADGAKLVETDVVAQMTGGSCVSATGEMITNGARTQTELYGLLGDYPYPLELGKTLGPEWKATFFGSGEEAIEQASRGPMAASLVAPGGQSLHNVVLEPLENGRFLVRDPWAGGSAYEVGEEWINQFVAAGVWK
jgi:hypothetical protein